jgi:hypothetical protein
MLQKEMICYQDTNKKEVMHINQFKIIKKMIMILMMNMKKRTKRKKRRKRKRKRRKKKGMIRKSRTIDLRTIKTNKVIG